VPAAERRRSNSGLASKVETSAHMSSCSPASSGPTRIGEFWSYPESRTFAELSINWEEDRILRAVLVGMLREADR
jgi:hypothetical protein